MINDCTAVILCGGKSSRMGYDKAFLRTETGMLLTITINCLQAIFSNVVLSTDENDKFKNISELSNIAKVSDIFIEKGPMGAIHASLTYLATPYIFIVPCDMPVINIELILDMYKNIGNSDIQICKHNNIIEPLFGFYKKSCIDIFERYLIEGNYKIRMTFKELNVHFYNIDTYNIHMEKVFWNLNTLEDVALWKKS
jgi:Molybdopterin-guanine dinucleotide biosynthesis protein A